MNDDEKTILAFGPYYLEQDPEMFLGEEVDRVTAHKKDGPPVTLYRMLPFDAAVQLCAKYFPDVSLASHPNFVQVLDVGCRYRIPFLVEEKIDGVTLEDLITERVRLSPALVAAIGVGVCESLSALLREQEQDVALSWELHPRFIWLTTNGEVKLSFAAVLEKIRGENLARVLDDSGPRIPMPDLRYLSLDRIRGADGWGRSSQFTVGSILCELSGRSPFGEEEGFQLLITMMTKEPVFASGVPGSLRAILLRAMDKGGKCFASYDAFADALRQYLCEAPCGYADIGALVRALKKSSNDTLEQEIERLSSLQWLRPDTDMEALTVDSVDWLEGRLDEHLALTETYFLGEELPCRKLVLSRSCNEVLRLLEEASIVTLPEQIFMYIKAQRAARQRTQDLCQTSVEASNIAERAVQRGLASFAMMPPNAPQETKSALQKIFVYREYEALFEAHLRHIALFGELLASPWEPLIQLWERGVWPLDMLSGGFLVYVPLHRGEVLSTEPNTSNEPFVSEGYVNRAHALR